MSIKSSRVANRREFKLGLPFFLAQRGLIPGVCTVKYKLVEEFNFPILSGNPIEMNVVAIETYLSPSTVEFI